MVSTVLKEIINTPIIKNLSRIHFKRKSKLIPKKKRKKRTVSTVPKKELTCHLK